MTKPLIDTIVRNLKLFNAKERDHLMRCAYLGENAAYDAPQKEDAPRRFLHEAFDAQLKTESGLDSEASCVFAGMDYHLDWLFVALWLSSKHPEWSPASHDLPPIEMDEHNADPNMSDLYTDFRPVMGNQEDVDLLAVYRNADGYAIVLVEAKGSAKFDRVQLARKLIRLDRIIMKSGIDKEAFRLVLVSPKEPRFKDCLTYARKLPEKSDSTGRDKFVNMREALRTHESGIGNGRRHLPMPGFPRSLYAVRRLPSQSGKHGDFTHWTIVPRKA